MRTIFIGPLGGGKTPTNGASIKNYHIVNTIKDYIEDLVLIDTEYWRKSPKVILRLLRVMATNRNGKYIVSTSSHSANITLRILQRCCPAAQTIYWVIGGNIGDDLVAGKYSANDYRRLKNIIVEGDTMKKEFNSCGLNNVSVLPNFKPMPDIDIEKTETNNKVVRFLFLSRILPAKGTEIILDAVSKLNQEGKAEKYIVDFYGVIEQVYEQQFKSRIAQQSNVTYQGFLDLRDINNYNKLSQYDVMLFPTYWKGEGCPGVVIDAYICGIPVIASDWHLNADYVKDGETGIIVKSKDVESLHNAMLEVISQPEKIVFMKQNAKSLAKTFDMQTVLSHNNLKVNGII